MNLTVAWHIRLQQNQKPNFAWIEAEKVSLNKATAHRTKRYSGPETGSPPALGAMRDARR